MIGKLIDKFFDGKNITILALTILSITAFYYLGSKAEGIVGTAITAIAALTYGGKKGE